MTELLVKTSTQAEQWITKIEFEKEAVRRLMEEMRGETQAFHRDKGEIQRYKKENSRREKRWRKRRQNYRNIEN